MALGQPWGNLGFGADLPAPGTMPDNRPRPPRIPPYPGTRPPPRPVPEWLQGYKDAMAAWKAQRPDLTGGRDSEAFRAWLAARPAQPQRPPLGGLGGGPGPSPGGGSGGDPGSSPGGGGSGEWGAANRYMPYNPGNQDYAWRMKIPMGTFQGGDPSQITGGWQGGGGGGPPTTPSDPTLVDYYDPLRRRSRFGSRFPGIGPRPTPGTSTDPTGIPTGRPRIPVIGEPIAPTSGSGFSSGKKGKKKKGGIGGTENEYVIKRPGLGVNPLGMTPMPGFKFPNYTQQWAMEPDIFGKTY